MERNPVVLEDLKQIVNSNIPWDILENKTIFITGANGFLPTYIIKSILYKNSLKSFGRTKIIAFVRNRTKANERFSDFLYMNELLIIEGSLTSSITIVDKIDFIIHAASQASPKYYGSDPVGTIEANTLGTYNLLKLANEKKVEKFLFFSSSEVYGKVPNKDFIKETDMGTIDPIEVRSCYSESKRMGENLCISFSHQFGVNVSIVRPFHTYGPGLDLNDARVFADFVSNVVHNKDLVINSDGSAIRSFCYIKDATIGFLIVLLKGMDQNVYNVANPDGETTIKNLANIIINIFPEKKLKATFKENKENYLPSKLKKLTPNIDKIKELGWVPITKIEEGFEKTILSFIIESKFN
jgi:nucleoside-diphosphate-sugar epimerase